MTPKQRDIMKHALGAGRGAPGWRNHFVTGPGSGDYDDCEALVTDAGMDALVGRKTPNAELTGHCPKGTERGN